MQDLKKTTELKFINNKKIIPIYLGKLDYLTALDEQYKYAKLVKDNPENVYILGLEHPKVLTLGYRARESEENFEVKDIPIIKTERGGLATIHSEGQLVIYPIVNLQWHKLGVRDFVCQILNSTKALLALYDIQARTEDKAIGLYTENGKIAFCGIQVKNGVSMHGLSLNVFNDLSLFENIIACGVKNQKLDSMKNYNKSDDLEKLFQQWSYHFSCSSLMQP